jgi:hypothetical protein
MSNEQTIGHQQLHEHNNRLVVLLVAVLVVVAVIVGYIRMVEKENKKVGEKVITPTNTSKTVEKTDNTPALVEPMTSTSSDEVTDIEADLKSTDIDF